MSIVPPGVPSLGMVTVIWTDTIADVNAPKVAELTSTTAALDLSCYLSASWGGPDTKQETVKDERYCSKVVFGTPGAVSFEFDEMTYVIDPQHPTSITEKARKMLTSGRNGFLVLRWGKDQSTPLTVGDYVDIYPAILGHPTKVKGDGNTPLKAKQAIFLSGSVAEDKVLA